MQNQVPDLEQIRHLNSVYGEKMREIRNLGFWLHVVAATLVTVEIPVIVAQAMEENLASVESVLNVNLVNFIHSFCIAFELLYVYFMFSVALCPPNTGCFEVVLLMLFNGISSHYYISFASESRADLIRKIWFVSAPILFTCTLETTFDQTLNIVQIAAHTVVNIWNLTYLIGCMIFLTPATIYIWFMAVCSYIRKHTAV
jgi:hypothetical protein